MGPSAAEQPHAPPPPPRRGVPGWLVGLGIAAASLYLLVGWVGGLLPDFGNPFTEETVDRSGPALLKSLRNLEEYRAASGHFELELAARGGSGLLARAEQNTRAMLTGLLRSLGFTRIEIRFAGV